MNNIFKITLIFIGVAFTTPAFSMKARTITLTDKKVARIKLKPGRSTIISFPMKPTKVILGNSGIFTVEYVDNDIALAALMSPARSNMFVYLYGKRFAFDLVTVRRRGDEIVIIRDAKDTDIKVKIK